MTQVYKARNPIKISPNAPALGIGIPCRALGPIEFYLCLFQALHPLNVTMSYFIQKGMLPAAARNAIIEKAISREVPYLIFLDDDVLFPDIALYRLWNLIRLNPDAAVITGIYGTKQDPSEPIFYRDAGSGAYLDWPLGTLIPIHSAGAGCMIVNMEYVKQLPPPWFDDQISTKTEAGKRSRLSFGHDRFFMHRLATETNGKIYGDTGLLLGHYDSETNRTFTIDPKSPCFQKPIEGEAFVPSVGEEGIIMWTRLIPKFNNKFRSYLQWLAEEGSEVKYSILEETEKKNDSARERPIRKTGLRSPRRKQ